MEPPLDSLEEKQPETLLVMDPPLEAVASPDMAFSPLAEMDAPLDVW